MPTLGVSVPLNLLLLPELQAEISEKDEPLNVSGNWHPGCLPSPEPSTLLWAAFHG